MYRPLGLLVLCTFLALPLFSSTPPIPVGGFGELHSYAPQIASDGSGYFLTWLQPERFFDTDQRIYGARVSRDGQLLDGGGISLSSDYVDSPAVKFDGSHYVVAFGARRRDTGVKYVRVLYISPATGLVVHDVRIPTTRRESNIFLELSPNANSLDLEVSSEATFLAWTEGSGIQLARIPHTTRIAEPVPLVVSDGRYFSNARLSWNGSMLLVVWNELRVRFTDPFVSYVPAAVYAARFDGTLTLLDPMPLVIDDFQFWYSYSHYRSPPSVASDGHEWIVVWMTDGSIRTVRVPAEGPGGQTAVKEIAKGNSALVFWSGDRYSLALSGRDNELLLADMISGDDQLATGPSRTIAGDILDSVPGVSAATRGTDREIALAYTQAVFGGFQAVFRIIDSPRRRRSVR